VAAASVPAASAAEWLYANEGNRMLRIDLAAAPGSAPLVEGVIPSASGAGATGGRGRDVNGMICAFPDGSGRLVAGEDTGQPAVPPGWRFETASPCCRRSPEPPPA